MNQEVIISEIQIVPIRPTNGLIGFASFVLDGKYYVGSIAIYTKRTGSGFRLVYPTKKAGETNINLFYPITREVGEAIEKAVTEKVDKLFNEDVGENYE